MFSKWQYVKKKYPNKTKLWVKFINKHTNGYFFRTAFVECYHHCIMWCFENGYMWRTNPMKETQNKNKATQF